MFGADCIDQQHETHTFEQFENIRRLKSMPRPVSVALLGFGNVGRAFARYVEANSSPIEIHIRAIAGRSGGFFLGHDTPLERVIAHKESGRLSELAPAGSLLNANDFIRALPSFGVSVLVESLPTNIVNGEPALTFITAALELGINVVTVDKGPLVHGFDALKQAARNGGARLGYSGTTGVGIPNEVENDRVLEIRGVLNGTTNYILSEMQERERSFTDALAQAQTEGIAEPDPSLDIQGWDTASKILILAKALMGADARLADVARIGIGQETESLIRTAKDSGRVVRLVGRARIWQGRVRVSVAPKLVGPDSPFYAISGTSKAAIFRTERQGDVVEFGRSGRDAIAQTIADDILKMVGRNEDSIP